MFWFLLKQLFVTCDVLFQRFWCRNLGPVDEVGGSARNRTIIITGPTSGIGKSTAASLARRGGRVILACRSLSKGEALKSELLQGQSENGNGGMQIEVRKLDVSDLDSVRQFVQDWNSTGRPLHLLINNAGVFHMAGPRTVLPSRMELHMATNHLGPFMLTLGLLPSLRKGGLESGDARVVNVSSYLHIMTAFDQRDPMLEGPGKYAAQLSYSQSKLAMNAFSVELQRRLPATSAITVCSLHPGDAITDVARSLPHFLQWSYKNLLGLILLTPDEGSRCTVYCATGSKVPEEAKQTFGYFASNCRPTMPSHMSRSKEFAGWLWKWSAEITKLPIEWDLPALG
ncbi:hypothetical protein BSKO_00296 [Bryopsis sp. KO-2023]|nr:hypothetical protein BSKO_00296 [Bryopsis sp. KO-2023]